jgi:phosphodiesterase/alkaline phosphatase D-like protein
MTPANPSRDRARSTATIVLFAAVAALLAVEATPAVAQSVTVGGASGLPGAAVDISVNFAAGVTSVSSLQFDLGFSGSLTYVSASAGTAATAAGKSVLGNVVAGGVRVVAYALNTTPISTGTVAVVRLSISAAALPGAVPITISSVVAADPSGNSVAVGASGGSVTVTQPADTTPPTISSVAASSITQTAAIITWTTNESSDTQVEYGTTTGYGSSSALNSTKTTAHSASLSGLTSGTLYHYRVKSRDNAGNLATSVDYTFTTSQSQDTTPPVITGVSVSSIGSASAVVSWTTNEAADTQVEYGTTAAYGSTSAFNPAMTTAHSSSLTGLTAGTLYHYRVKSRDAAGNLANSSDYTFTTSQGSDSTPPVISSILSSSITSTTALITWTTNEVCDALVEYGTTSAYGSSTALNPTLTTSHSAALSGLAAGMLYHYRVKSRDAAGNLAISGDNTFTTQAGGSGTLTITQVVLQSITDRSVYVTWTTSKMAGTEVEYGPSKSYGFLASTPGVWETQHGQKISGLASSTVYHLRVRSADSSGNLAVSDDYEFTTLESNDSTPPAITGVTVSMVTYHSALISWTTNEEASTQVEYGQAESYGSFTTLGEALTTAHSQAVDGLMPDSTYHFRVKSKDRDGNLGVSGDFTLKTKKLQDGGGEVQATLFFPRLPQLAPSDGQSAATDGLYSGVAIANLDTVPATLVFTACGRGGEAISGADIANPVVRVLQAGEQLPIIDEQLFGSGLHGQVSVDSVRIESSSAKVVGMFMVFDAGVNVLDGANLAATPVSTFLLTEVAADGYTSVSVTNPGTEEASIRFELISRDGYVKSTTTRTVTPQGSLLVNAASELFRDAGLEKTDYIRGAADKAVTPLQIFGKGRQHAEALNGQDAAAGAFTLYSPQYAVGGPWHSTLTIVNLDGVSGSVTLRCIGNDGAQIGATRLVPIAPNGKIYVDDRAFFQASNTKEVLEGYVEIQSTSLRLVGSVVFGDPAGSQFAAALPLVRSLQQSLVFPHIASGGQYFMGLAILNPYSDATTVTIDLYGADGVRVASTTESIPARQRRSKLLTEFFPILVGQERSSGYIRVTANKAVASFALFGTDRLSVLSAVPAQEAPK